MDPEHAAQNSTAVARINRHIECAKCGYDLCGLARNSVCPECSEPVENSLAGRWLRFADREWVDRIMRGLRIEEACRQQVFLGFFAMIVMILLTAVVTSVTDFSIEGLANIVTTILGAWMLLCVAGLGVGLWRASESEPGSERDGHILQSVLRLSSAFVIPALALWSAVDKGLSLPPWQNIMIVQFCFAIVVIHMLEMVRLADELESRCIGSTVRRRNSVQISGAVACSLILLALYWIGPLRMSQQRAWTPPNATNNRMLFFLVALIWLALVSRFRLTLKCVRQEIAAP